MQSATLLGAGAAVPADAARAEKAKRIVVVPASRLDVDTSQSELRPYFDRFDADHSLLRRYYPVTFAPQTRERMRAFYTLWQSELAAMPFESLSQDARLDYLLLRNDLQHSLRTGEEEAQFQQRVDRLLPFAGAILRLEQARREMVDIDGKASAATLALLETQIADTRAKVEVQVKAGAKDKEAVNRAVQQAAVLRGVLRTWYGFYDGYDPEFSWWVEVPYKSADKSLGSYSDFLAVQILGLTPAPEQGKPVEGDPGSDDNAFAASVRGARAGTNSDIIGHAIGEAGLQAELDNEVIAYTPAELIAIANAEFAWCNAEMLKASREMGFGDNWHAALAKVKNTYVKPGAQPDLVRDDEREAEAFVVQHDLVTIPPLAHETWRRIMISPQQQLISPFFLGGEVMQIAYPTNEMTYEQRLTSMRANNTAMSHAEVFHELIPGHELQLFMVERYRAYRRAVQGTPFLIEGWALYWEMLLYSMGFQRTPENRVGALEWRMHRCARIIFSLSFHLGTMTPQQCIDLLVERVGFEPQAAAGEVRRSFSGAYSPLYQAAYLLGGLQLRALHGEMVPGKMTNREFHDVVLRQGEIPIELLRAGLLDLPLTRDYKAGWKFYGPVGPVSPVSPG